MTASHRMRPHAGSTDGGNGYDAGSPPPSVPGVEPTFDVGDPPGSPSYHGEGRSMSTHYEEQAEFDVGAPPGGPEYFGEGGSAASGTMDQPSDDVGDAPGSAAYYGEPASSDAPADLQASAETAPVALGAPPGSSSYFGGQGSDQGEAGAVDALDPFRSFGIPPSW